MLVLDAKIVHSLDILGKIISPAGSLIAGVLQGIWVIWGALCKVPSALGKAGWGSGSLHHFYPKKGDWDALASGFSSLSDARILTPTPPPPPPLPFPFLSSSFIEK